MCLTHYDYGVNNLMCVIIHKMKPLRKALILQSSMSHIYLCTHGECKGQKSIPFKSDSEVSGWNQMENVTIDEENIRTQFCAFVLLKAAESCLLLYEKIDSQ